MTRLAMSLVVRDEIELISANIEFHAAHGVDAFFVMDNGSTDGTRERLEELKRTHDIVGGGPAGHVLQARRMGDRASPYGTRRWQG